jgi:hypothetical protein
MTRSVRRSHRRGAVSDKDGSEIDAQSVAPVWTDPPWGRSSRQGSSPRSGEGPEPDRGPVRSPCSIRMITRPIASTSVNASFAPVATRSMTPLTWPRRSSATRTTKLERLPWLIWATRSAFVRRRSGPAGLSRRSIEPAPSRRQARWPLCWHASSGTATRRTLAVDLHLTASGRPRGGRFSYAPA